MTDKNTADKHAIDNNVAQGIAAYIDYLNQLRVSTLMDTLRQILNNETGQLKDLAERQANALRNLDLANQNVMNIVNSGRGGENGMHGFIAEFAQTGIANARRAFEGLEKSTITLNNNGPADLLINGKPVQVKFYANLMNELKTSAEYRSMDMMFSKDHMDVFRAVMHGDKEVYLKAGMQDYCTKPYKPEMLDQMIQRWLHAEQVGLSTAFADVPSMALSWAGVGGESDDEANHRVTTMTTHKANQ